MPFVLGLGAHEAIDFKAERFEDRVQDADLVFDLVNGETLDRSWNVLKRGGALISTLREPDAATARERGVKAARYMAQPNGAQLGEVGDLVETGKVVPAIARVMALDEVAAAHTLLEHGHLRGKLIIRVA
jgi:NADPH:quinone reductase-like Zn-dependent oxidoreductase